SKIKVGRSCLPTDSHLLLAFATPSGFSTLRLAYGVDSLVRVSRRVSRSLFYTISRWTLRPISSVSPELPPTRTGSFQGGFLEDLPHRVLHLGKSSKGSPVTPPAL